MRIHQNRFKYAKADLYSEIQSRLFLEDKKQKEVAEQMGICESAFSRKVRTGNFKFEELLKLFEIMDFPDDAILKVMRPQIK